jgi:hypothetical protein
LCGKTCQDKMNQRRFIPHHNPESFAKAASKAVDFGIMFDDDDGFFGFTVPERREGPVLDTPRAAAFTILELSKLVVFKAHYQFFKTLESKLLFTDTDSLTYLIRSDNLFADLLESVRVDFDLANTLKSSEEVRNVLRSRYEPVELKRQVCIAMNELKSNKGKLGAFKLESDRNCLVEFVGLAPKMYSFKVMQEDGEVSTYMKGKGVPSKVLKSLAKHEDYRRMLFEPYESSASFRKLQSKNHEICGFNMRKRMLTALQDKTFQEGPTVSRPLGHWKNHIPDDEEDEL